MREDQRGKMTTTTQLEIINIILKMSSDEEVKTSDVLLKGSSKSTRRSKKGSRDVCLHAESPDNPSEQARPRQFFWLGHYKGFLGALQRRSEDGRYARERTMRSPWQRESP